MPTDKSTSNGRTGERRAQEAPPLRPASPDILDTDQLLAVLTAVRKGDFSVTMPMTRTGVDGQDLRRP